MRLFLGTMNTLITDIKNTLAYFDQFSHPLTATELWNFLWQPTKEPVCTWFEFITTLEQGVSDKLLGCLNGFYFLLGQESHVASRQRARLLVERKLDIARRAASVLGAVPGVEAIIVCNTVAAGWPSVQSDIDLLVVVKPGRLWLTRFLFTVTTICLTKRRHNHSIADHLCLSFFITRDHLNISSIRSGEPDIYLIYWIQQLVLLTGDSRILTEIRQANQWVRQYTPNYNQEGYGHQPMVTIHPIMVLVKKIIERGSFLFFENIARFFQKKRIDSQTHAPVPAVVISDTMLKFHEQDRRDHYQKVWHSKIAELK